MTSEANPWLGTISWRYDAAGRRTRLTWADGFYVTYDHDAAGAVTAIRENGGAALASYGYDDLGRRVSVARGNGVTTSYGYDGAGRLASFAHDLNGTAGDVATTFGYNPAGQIASRTSSNDLFAWRGAVNVDRSYGSNGLNQYTWAGGVTFGYDGRGNLTGSGSTAYGYNGANQMVSAPGELMVHDPVDRLFYSQAEATLFRYDGGAMTAEQDSNTGAVKRRYVPGPGEDEPVVWYEGSGAGDRRWLVADERGSVVAVTPTSPAQ